MEPLNYDPPPGTHIDKACAEACSKAWKENRKVNFDFNGVTITATPTSSPVLLAKSFQEESERRHKEYLASPEHKAHEKERAKREAERKAKVEEILANGPETLSLIDRDGWEKSKANNTDPYGSAVMTYAERWARLMEARMNNGEPLADIVDECSRLADEEGISGFQKGCAQSLLIQVWKHGFALSSGR